MLFWAAESCSKGFGVGEVATLLKVEPKHNGIKTEGELAFVQHMKRIVRMNEMGRVLGVLFKG